jgi:hypothetical protein
MLSSLGGINISVDFIICRHEIKEVMCLSGGLGNSSVEHDNYSVESVWPDILNAYFRLTVALKRAASM